MRFPIVGNKPATSKNHTWASVVRTEGGEGNKGVSKHIKSGDVYSVGPQCKILWMNRSRLRVLRSDHGRPSNAHKTIWNRSLKKKQVRYIYLICVLEMTVNILKYWGGRMNSTVRLPKRVY